MGIVNASPDSFSDDGRGRTLDAQVDLAAELLAAGADILDVGGESGRTDTPPVSEEQESALVVPLVQRLTGELGALVSVDTYKPAVAEAAVAAGATVVNDVSGLRDPALAEVCARSGAALVLTHTRAEPKQKALEHPYEDVMDDVLAFLRERIALAMDRGVAREQLLLDPGPDFAKSPAQTVEVLRRAGELHALERPLLLAVSRKDFIGAIGLRRPGQRVGGTLAALAHGVDAGAHVLRVHDVADAAEFLAVRAALRGDAGLPADARVPDHLRREDTR